MLTKIKMFIITQKHKYCCYVVRHYVDKSNKFIEKGDYEHSQKCWKVIDKHLRKQSKLLFELLEMA